MICTLCGPSLWPSEVTCALHISWEWWFLICRIYIFLSHWRSVLSRTKWDPAAPYSLLGLGLVQNTPQSPTGTPRFESPCVSPSPQAGHRWLGVALGKVATIAGQLLAVPRQASLHEIFLHPCLPGKTISKVFCTSFHADPFYDWKLSKKMPGCWLIWLVVFLPAVPICFSTWADWLLEVWV